jgi:hypothetical protein
MVIAETGDFIMNYLVYPEPHGTGRGLDLGE